MLEILLSRNFVGVKDLPHYKVLYCLWLYSIPQGKSSEGGFVPSIKDCQNEIETSVKSHRSVNYFGGRVIQTNFSEVKNN